MTRLRRLRRWGGGAVFAVMTLVFIDFFGWVPVWVSDAATATQFLPSLIRLFSRGWGAMAGCLVLIGVTLLFGRIYCSVLCPLGILFDGAARLKGRRRYRYSSPRTRIRVAVVVGIGLSVAGGSFVLVDLVEPFGLFGRSATLIARPLAIFASNGLSRMLEMGGSYLLPPWPLSGIAWEATACAAATLATLVWLARVRGRWYCNTLCPVGAVLGLVASGARHRVWIDASSCTSCGRCSRVCKAECIDPLGKTVDMTRCVACFNCLGVCPSGSLFYGRPPQPHCAEKEPPAPSSPGPASSERRALMLSALVTLVPSLRLPAACAAPPPRSPGKSLVPVVRTRPVTPPGSGGQDHFTRRCISCLRCVGACPSQVLQPSLTGYGLRGFMMPSLQPRFGYCVTDCHRCGQVCPTGAIRELPLEEKQVTQLGKAVFVRDNCIVLLHRTACGACSEHCPTKAVTMAVEKGLRVPLVNPDLCIGCGACEYACPTKPFKAIYVEGNRVHVPAEKPGRHPAESRDTGFKETDAFPF